MTASRALKLGTRGSPLALWQANWIKSELERTDPHLAIDLIPIKTTGDRILDVPLAAIGGKGLFTKELDEALFDGRIDFAVHSLKDVPFRLPDGLEFGAIPQREDPWDAFVSNGRRLDEMPAGAVIGTGSLRRQIQIRRRFPVLELVALRGNIDTRLRKLDSGECDGIVLAVAGLKRLGHSARITQVLDEETMLPAVGQGALAVVCRAADASTLGSLSSLDHAPSRIAITAERGLLRVLEGSCQIPIAALARISGPGTVVLKGLIAGLDGRQAVAAEMTGASSKAYDLGVALGEELLRKGADKILAEIRKHGASR